MIDINKLKLVIWDLDDTFWTGTVDNINAHDKIKGYSVEMKKTKKILNKMEAEQNKITRRKTKS